MGTLFKQPERKSFAVENSDADYFLKDAVEGVTVGAVKCDLCYCHNVTKIAG